MSYSRILRNSSSEEVSDDVSTSEEIVNDENNSFVVNLPKKEKSEVSLEDLGGAAPLETSQLLGRFPDEDNDDSVILDDKPLELITDVCEGNLVEEIVLEKNKINIVSKKINPLFKRTADEMNTVMEDLYKDEQATLPVEAWQYTLEEANACDLKGKTKEFKQKFEMNKIKVASVGKNLYGPHKEFNAVLIPSLTSVSFFKISQRENLLAKNKIELEKFASKQSETFKKLSN